MQSYEDEERDSSEEFEIILNDEQEPSEKAELLDTYTIECDTLSDKPWNKPGEDITDYFNYGFNEGTWKDYLAKQKKLREEYPTRKKKEKEPWERSRVNKRG